MKTAAEWAIEQWGSVELGDKRRTRRAVAMGARMAERTEVSLPKQMHDWAETKGAYRLLNNGEVTLAKLIAPHIAATVKKCNLHDVVLLAEDSTILDYTHHKQKKGLGPIGDEYGRGMIVHSTLAIEPSTREVLGLMQMQVVLRRPQPKPKPTHYRSPEGLLWEVSAKTIPAPPAGHKRIRVTDRGSDLFEYMLACEENGASFVVRSHYNRQITLPEDGLGELRRLLDHSREQPAVEGSQYRVKVAAREKHPAREATLGLAWIHVCLPVPKNLPPATRAKGALWVYGVRAFETDPPPGVDAVEWVLLTNVPVLDLAQAKDIVAWYECRWLCEEYHMCLKTGCGIQASQLDEGLDIQRLLGFAAPIAVRLLQLKHHVHLTPTRLARKVVQPLMVQVLALRQKRVAVSMTLSEFWKQVARLGGHLGRTSDGTPGWRTLWQGWQLLSALTAGAQLFNQLRKSKRSG